LGVGETVWVRMADGLCAAGRLAQARDASRLEKTSHDADDRREGGPAGPAGPAQALDQSPVGCILYRPSGSVALDGHGWLNRCVMTTPRWRDLRLEIRIKRRHEPETRTGKSRAPE
jgi:hypothetical protein